MTDASPTVSSLRRACVLLAAALFSVWGGNSALALSLESAESTIVETRDGAVVRRGTDKVSSPSLPLSSTAEQTFGPIVPDGDEAGSASGTIVLQANAVFVADPGDAPGAALCVTYRFSASVAANVVAATASVAGGIGAPSGFVLNTGAQPVSVVVPNPVVLTVTPTVGPVRTIFSNDPQTFAAATGGGAASALRTGTFLVQAGDTVDFAVQTGVGARAEPPSGAASITASQAQFSLREGCVEAVPSLSDPALVGLGLLIALLTALGGGLNVVRRTRR